MILVRDTFQAIIKDGGTFNMIEALAILKAAHEAAHASDDELEPAVCSLYRSCSRAYGTWWHSLL